MKILWCDIIMVRSSDRQIIGDLPIMFVSLAPILMRVPECNIGILGIWCLLFCIIVVK